LVIVFNGPRFFVEAQYIDVSLHLIEPGGAPDSQEIFLIPSLDVQIAAADFSGGFAPAVPEPSTWVMLLLGFAGFGLVAHHARQPSNRISRLARG
jgi:PEP-CTERM motif